MLDVLGLLFRLWKGLEDIKNAADDTVTVPVEDQISLIEQTAFLLGQKGHQSISRKKFR